MSTATATVIISTIVLIATFFGLWGFIKTLWKKKGGKVIIVIVLFLVFSLNTWQVLSASSDADDAKKEIIDTTISQGKRTNDKIDTINSNLSKLKNPNASDIGILAADGKKIKLNPYLMKGNMESTAKFCIEVGNWGKGDAYNLSTSYAIIAADEATATIQSYRTVDKFSSSIIPRLGTQAFTYPINIVSKQTVPGVSYYFCWFLTYQDDYKKDSIFAVFNTDYGKLYAPMTSPNDSIKYKLWNAIEAANCFKHSN